MAVVANAVSLNDDCLRHIFSHMGIAERIKVERVCKHWKRLSRSTWSSFKRMDFQKESWGYDRESRLQGIDYMVLQAVFKRGGKNFKEISFENVRNISSGNGNAKVFVKRMAQLIVKYSRKVEAIQHLPVLDSEVLIILASRCKNLKEFSISFIETGCESSLRDLLELNRGIRKMHIYYAASIVGWCIGSLNPDTLESLEMGNAASFDVEHLDNLQRFSKLKRLILDDLRDTEDWRRTWQRQQPHNIEPIALPLHEDCRPQYLDLSHFQSSLNLALDFAKLVNLKKLIVPGNEAVDDEFLVGVAMHCLELELLNIWNCKRPTSYGVSNILELPCLEHLDMRSLVNVDDNAFLPRMERSPPLRLKHLECVSCPRLSNAALLAVAINAPDLSYLDLRYTRATEDLYDEIVKIGRRDPTGNLTICFDRAMRVVFKDPQAQAANNQDNIA